MFLKSKFISHKNILSVLTTLTLCFVVPLYADSMDDYVRGELARQHIPGLAVVVTQSGKIVKVAGYGYANLEHQVPVKPETVFQSGSISKQLTATVAMLLVEDGKLLLDAHIGHSRIRIRRGFRHAQGLHRR